MTLELCDDCLAAERDPHGIGITHAGRLCCMARAVAGSPRRSQRQAFDAATAHLSPLDAHALRVRAHEIIRRKREAAGEELQP